MSRAREFADLASSADAGGITGKNLITNGAMSISQRGSSFSYAHDGTTAAYNLDRFNFGMRTTADEYDCTVAQVSDSPDGFSNSLKITTGTAESAIGADEYYQLYQPIEAQNLQLLGYGTSSAKAMTLSFYVKSSLTGTFASSFYQADDNRILNKTYTINSANTWERKTISIPADTTGVIDNDNGGGMWVYWGFGAGSDFDGGTTATTWSTYTTTNFFDSSGSDALITTAGATWQVTGVQLELGEQATPFEHRSIEDELAQCQRYYFRINEGVVYQRFGNASCASSNSAQANIILPVTMRATPDVHTTGTAGDYAVYEAGVVHTLTSLPTINTSGSSAEAVNIACYSTGNYVAGNVGEFISNNDASVFFALSAEL